MNADKISAARTDMLKQYGKKEDKVADKSEMNKDMFLNLLVTQMQYQDPLEPTKNEDFLAQMAQFSALEQMKNLNTGFMMQQGNNLIGKVVSGKIVDEDSGKTEVVVGMVKSIRLENSEVYLILQDEQQKVHELKLSKVEEVGDNVESYMQKASLDTINETLIGISKSIATLSKKVDKLESESVEGTEANGEANGEVDGTEEANETTDSLSESENQTTEGE